MALLQDSRGDIWVGTEDKGVWRYSQQIAQTLAAAPSSAPVAGKKPVIPSPWTQYSLKEGLGDDTVYALAEDRKGRIWAGTLRNGVSCFNGKEWRNYGLLDGPLGERVFAIATCPSDGDVWVATNAGLCRYSLKNDSWSYFTRAEGLPSDQIQALAFDSLGNLYAGTQCDGLAMAKSEDNYKQWAVVSGPSVMPLTCIGTGLPSSQINDVLVADDDTVYVATTCGLARSKDFGQSWNFIRGVDWSAKVKGLRSHPTPQLPQENLNRELLREDYVTNLSEDSRGLLLISYRVKGYEYRRPLNDRVPYVSAKSQQDQFPYVSTTLPLKDGSNVLANYGDGLTQAVPVPEFVPTAEEKQEMEGHRGWKQITPPTAVPPLPSPAKAPGVEELKALLARLETPGRSMQPGEGYFEGDDWRTWGDWVGRYGSRYAMFCAASAPLNLSMVNDPSYLVKGYMGPGFPKNSLRHWIHQKQWDNPRVLYIPHLGYRREAEWDDNAETMPFSIEGPDVWARVTVPAGTHRLSTYYFNKDGHWGNNRMRDYLLELKKGDAKSVEEAEKLPTQAHARLRDFWGGVYKRFLVQGPGTFWLKVGKNNSFNTILCGVFLDKSDGPPTRYENRRSTWLGTVRYETPLAISALPKEQRASVESDPLLRTDPVITARRLWDQASLVQGSADAYPVLIRSRTLAFRAVATSGWGNFTPAPDKAARGSSGAVQTLLKRWRWQLPYWLPDDRAEFQENMANAYASLIVKNPQLQKIEY